MPTTPTTTETPATLGAFVHSQRPRAWSLAYPAAVREHVQVYAAERRSAGANARMVAEELGLSRHSVRSWSAPRSAPAGLRAVLVVPDREPLSSAATPASSSSPSAPILVSPKGYRVEGLDVAALATLVAAVG